VGTYPAAASPELVVEGADVGDGGLLVVPAVAVVVAFVIVRFDGKTPMVDAAATTRLVFLARMDEKSVTTSSMSLSASVAKSIAVVVSDAALVSKALVTVGVKVRGGGGGGRGTPRVAPEPGTACTSR
jgi:hypothetical protein